MWGRAGLCEERAWHLLLHDLISSRAGSLLRHPGRPHAFLHVFLLEIRTRPREKSCFGGNQRTTTLFSLGNTHPSERKVVFRWKPTDDDTVFSWKYAPVREESRVSVETNGRRHCFLLEIRTRPREKSCFGGNQRTTTLFSLGNTHPSERKVVFRWKPTDDDTVFSWKYAPVREESRVSVETNGRRHCFLLEIRTRPREKSCFGGNQRTTTLFSLGNTHPSERKVVFRWKPTDDDTVFSWKYAPVREKSRVSVETNGRRHCFL